MPISAKVYWAKCLFQAKKANFNGIVPLGMQRSRLIIGAIRRKKTTHNARLLALF